MAVMIKCKMCGGDLLLAEGSTIATCEYCGTQQTVPAADNEKKMSLFVRANKLRFACEFDKAAGIYESIAAEFPDEAEGYWGLVLCKYGIEYVDDPATGKKIPTCHRSSFDSVMDDGNFEQTLENADTVSRKVYREEAKQIEEIRKGIIEVSAKEEPYDIFICYKETAEDGQRTVDSVMAQDIYDALTEKGYRTFFARITLEDKLGQEYEPYIFAALNSAKVMLSIGTDYEHFNAVWVKNEWSRFLKLMEKDKNKHLIPCYKGIDAYDMPKEFNKLQAQDLGKVGAVQDLLRGIDKLIAVKPVAAQPAPQMQTEDLNRSFIYNSALQKGEEKKISSIKQAIKKLETIADYADAQEQIQRLRQKLKKKKTIRMVSWLSVFAIIVAIVLVSVIFNIRRENADRKAYYEMGLEAMESGEYNNAVSYFAYASNYEDSEALRQKAEIYRDESSVAISKMRNIKKYVSEDGEVLNLSGWTGTTYTIGAGSSTAGGAVPEETVPSDGTPTQNKNFSVDGTFYYSVEDAQIFFKAADGSQYTVTHADGEVVFHGNGVLDGRTYRHYAAYILPFAQQYVDKGLLYTADALLDAVLEADGLPGDLEMQATQMLNQISSQKDAYDQYVEDLFGYEGNWDQQTMDMLMEQSAAGHITEWVDVLESGDYLGEVLSISCDIYVSEHCSASKRTLNTLLQIAEQSPDLAMSLDWYMDAYGFLYELRDRVATGSMLLN